MNKIALLLVFLVALLCTGCSPRDDLLDDLYTRNIYPSANITFDLGSPTYTWDEGFFRLIHADNITGNVTESDPLWSASASFGITAGDIAGWDLPSGRSVTLVVAASDSSAIGIAQSDYQCSGAADDV